MQDGAILGDVDFIASEHGIDFLPKTGGVGQIDEAFDRFFDNEILGIIKKKTNGFELEFFGAVRIFVEQIGEVREGFRLGCQGFPCRVRCDGHKI